MPGLALRAPRAAPPARWLRATQRRPAPRPRHDEHRQQHQQHRPPPHGANGQRSGAGSSDDLTRIRRIIAALLRKADATSYPHKAAACRETAEALRAKVRPLADERIVTSPVRPATGPGSVLLGSSRRHSSERNGTSQVRLSVSYGSSRGPRLSGTDRHADQRRERNGLSRRPPRARNRSSRLEASGSSHVLVSGAAVRGVQASSRSCGDRRRSSCRPAVHPLGPGYSWR